ncbi:MAG: winged helix-turn-helix domain-containing protein [Acidobacteriaceae bacterium]|nr:winged helix-turn-helix domain-containing protein [Acidobacteriaceae bacterium]
MATQPQPRYRFAFGPFEVDGYTGQLSKSGIRIRLPGQPFQILLALLAHPGQLVTRQQLRDRIWRDGTNVDFEHSLNVAVNRLRRALNDSAESPRYIETVPGRGYRFIGVLDEPPKLQAVPPVELPVTVETSRPSNGKLWVVIGAAVLLIAVIAAALSFRSHPKPSFAEKGTLVLSSFRNTTGDPVFDDTLQQGLVVQLQQSPFLSLVSENRVRLTLRLMGRPSGQVLTSDLAREVCERTGSSAVIEGSIARLGSRYVVGLNAKSCSGETIYVEQLQAMHKENVLDALSQIVRKFRQGVGESRAVIRQHDTPLAEATTPSLDALKAYSTARKVAFSASFNSAVPLLQRAIELDPGFAMAHAFLGRIYADIGESVKSAESTRRAYELRDRATEHERFFITFSYDRQVTGNLDSALQTAELWAHTFPRDAEPHALLSGFSSQGLGRYEKTIAEAGKAIALDPDITPAYLNLAFGYVFLNRFDEAEAALKRAADRQLEIPDSQILGFYIAFLKHDEDGMNRAKLRMQAMPDEEDWMPQSEALVAAHAGRLRWARALSQQAVDTAQRSGHIERAAIYRAGSAAWEALFGNTAKARENAAAAMKLSNARDVEYGAAFALSLAHDDARAQVLANDLAKRFPEDTLVQFTYLPALNALASLHRGRPAEALSALRTNLALELATPGTNFFGFFGGLYPAYLRGQSYLMLGKPNGAALEFQKIVDHPGVVFADPIGALAHLEIGRASTLAQNRAGAKAAYQKFMELWRDADPDIPIFKQAKAELARLN